MAAPPEPDEESEESEVEGWKPATWGRQLLRRKGFSLPDFAIPPEEFLNDAPVDIHREFSEAVKIRKRLVSVTG